MAGIALIFDNEQPIGHYPDDWYSFLRTTAAFKRLKMPSFLVESNRCVAGKLDADCSLHRGITHQPETGSWLMATGTLIDPIDPRPDGGLERLLCDYLNQGRQVLSRLDGQFALAIYDARIDEITVASDPLGMIPLYHGRRGSRFYISTSALAVAKMICPIPDPLRTRAFLLYGDLLGGTLWQDVHCLPPATVLTLSHGGSDQFTYWTFNIDHAVSLYSENDAVDCMLESFSQTMRQSLQHEGKIWVSLTGGLDSRMLAALTSYSQFPFKTYCHGPMDSRDVRIAEHISRAMDWEYEYFRLPEDWGNQRVEWLSQAVEQTDGGLEALKLTRTIREQTLKAKQMEVSIWGYGGEIYRGYYWKQEFWHTGVTALVDYDRLLNFRLNPLDASVLFDGPRWNSAVREALQAGFQTIGEREPNWPNTVKLDLIGLQVERLVCGGTVSAVLGQQRVPLPFYFKENMRRAISINYRWRKHSRLFRRLLERINPELAGMATADGGPALPMRLSNAHRFIPYWLDAGERLAWKLGFQHLGKGLWGKRNPGQDGRAYPSRRWLDETVAQLVEVDVLLPEKMSTAGLYQLTRLKTLLDGSQPWSLAREALIGRVIAVEMAMRLVGTGC